ncbi:MAG: hypothetical protein JW973_08080 [Bacteroidales bacterium]|nr:hypothetical protein [Bacteroidales bacterium]
MLSLTNDHRVIDGALGGTFLNASSVTSSILIRTVNYSSTSGSGRMN